MRTAFNKYYLQYHSSKTTLRWLIRLLEYDMKTSNISAQLKWAQFRLSFDQAKKPQKKINRPFLNLAKKLEERFW